MSGRNQIVKISRLNKQKYLEKKEYDRSLRKLRKRLEDSEAEIGKIEAEISSP